MEGSRLLIWLLILATVLVDGVALSMAGTGRWPQLAWPHPVLSVLFALPFSQVSLAAVWVGLGVESVPWRLMGGFLVVACWSIALAATLNNAAPIGYTSTHWAALLLGQTLVILLHLSIARTAGVRLAQAPAARPTPYATPARSPWQFSLSYLFAWILAVAVVLGMVQYTVRYELLPRVPIVWVEIGILSISYAAIALAAGWAVLGTRRAMLRIAMLCLTTGAITSLHGLLPPRADHRFALAVVCLLQALLLVGSLYVFRVAGYRMRMKGGNGEG